MEMDSEKEIILESPEVDEVENVMTNYTATHVFEKAIDFFPEVRMAEFRTLAAEKDVDIAKGNYFPTLSLSRDRKSTRLNSSHVKISYAVFCLKKKN